MLNRYYSKIDRWVLVVLILAGIAELVALVTTISVGTLAERVFTTVIIITISGLVTWSVLTTYYYFESDQLVIRAGPFRWQVPVREIHSITPTHDPLSSPALSLDRLRIEYGPKKRAIMISPRESERFLAELEQRRAGEQK